MTVRPLRPQDHTAYVALRQSALVLEPHAFGSSTEDDHSRDPRAVEALLLDEVQRTFGAFDHASRLLGVIGVRQSTKRKLRHQATLWGTYVVPQARGTGLGRALLDVAITHARILGARCVACEVSSTADDARRLYESAGFQCWGRNPAGLCIDGEFIAADHLILWL